MMKKCFFLLFLLLLGTSGIAQKRYEVLQSPTAEMDSTQARVVDVYTVGDSLVLVECIMTSQVEREIMLPKVSLLSKLVVGSFAGQVETQKDSLTLRNIVAYDPDTKQPSEHDLLGLRYWKGVKPGRDYLFVVVFEGKLNVGQEYLSLVCDSEEHYSFRDIKIENSLESALRHCYLSRPTTTVNVRKGPSKESAVITRLQPSQLMVAEDNVMTKPEYCKVVVLSTGQEGYVHRKYIKFGELLPNVSSGALAKVADKGLKVAPEVKIANTSNITLNLNIGGKTYVLKPNSRRTLTLKSGMCYMVATGVGCQPYFGVETLDEGCEYSWTFSVK